jgi:ketosteroid isomerase-like protein
MDSLSVESRNLGVDSSRLDSESNGVSAESANLRAIREAFRAFIEDGVEAGVERLMEVAHEECVFRPYTAGERVLHGREQARAFFRDAVAAGATMTVRPQSFEEYGDEVVVTGTVRLLRPGGGFAESQIRWIYAFRDGLVEEARWGPRSGA